MSPVISFEGVSKSFTYFTDRTDSVKLYLIRALKGQIGLGHRTRLDVLRNVTFDIKPGEFVGIMGKNGVGKSTILKLISKIYHPNQGKVRIRGQVIPLLELGAGFAPDLSGYDNIFLNASILGFSKFSVEARVQSILEFSELGEKIHMSVKNYSSGMLMRLGFSIASQMDADIILLDEVLAVGDAHFQEKCLQRVHELHAQGKTIVLVSHFPEQVRKFCDRCIVLGPDGVLHDGGVAEGTRIYEDINR